MNDQTTPVENATEATPTPIRIEGLTDRQQRFVAEYLVDHNASRAARAAGYSAQRAKETGCRLLKKPVIRKAVDAALAKHLGKLEATVDSVLQKLVDTVERCSAKGQDFQPYAVLKGCELLGRHLKMFTDRLETEDVSLIERLNAGKMRIAKLRESNSSTDAPPTEASLVEPTELPPDLVPGAVNSRRAELPLETPQMALARAVAESGQSAAGRRASSGPYFNIYEGKTVTKQENANG